jgi:acyl carrier protein
MSDDLATPIVGFVVELLEGEVTAEELLGPPPIKLTEALDSMALMELATFLEDEFNVAIPDAEVTRENFSTIDDVVTLVQAKLTKILLPPPRLEVTGSAIVP